MYCNIPDISTGLLTDTFGVVEGMLEEKILEGRYLTFPVPVPAQALGGSAASVGAYTLLASAARLLYQAEHLAIENSLSCGSVFVKFVVLAVSGPSCGVTLLCIHG